MHAGQVSDQGDDPGGRPLAAMAPVSTGGFSSLKFSANRLVLSDGCFSQLVVSNGGISSAQISCLPPVVLNLEVGLVSASGNDPEVSSSSRRPPAAVALASTGGFSGVKFLSNHSILFGGCFGKPTSRVGGPFNAHISLSLTFQCYYSLTDTLHGRTVPSSPVILNRPFQVLLVYKSLFPNRW